MNHKTLSLTSGLIAIMTVATLGSASARAETKIAVPSVQTMDAIIVRANYLPSTTAAKLERIVVSAKRDQSDMKSEPIAHNEVKLTNVGGEVSSEVSVEANRAVNGLTNL